MVIETSFWRRVANAQSMKYYILHIGRTTSERSLLIYRLLAFIFHLIIFCIILALETERAKLLVFLTIWGFLLTAVYFLLSFIETAFLRGTKPFIWKSCVALLEITISLEFLITLFYWVVLFQFDYDRVTSSGLLFFVNLSVHGICYVTLCFDLHFNCIIFDRSHWIFVALAMAAYGVVNCLYTLTKEYIYPPIIYTDVFTYLYLIFAFILAIGGFHLKSHITSKYKKDQLDKLSSTLSDRNDSENHPYIGMRSGENTL